MILEVARINVKAGMTGEFESNVGKAVPLFLRARGCHGIELQRSIERKNGYLLLVKWQTLENHTVDFRGSEDFKQWRQLVGHCLEGTPAVEHTELAVDASAKGRV
ncbi:antibiotic biosynthesis monooxygenase family protein [Bradyrhizobium sp. NP1]|uniref:antibiotic biosynthesis monooxygenase family protein n=1 Tax=Bradyrhizobium sp. NP1 TaxID=3049772 RepID=UPI0025A58F79|nr:antibiotic biosynthesis monooxygenase family protein [Bradyrhizobium sp. NP1]WJR76618.1 antibiotic biosynthesis monooxygenase family protein [Bradyrhizobium sp. NP1]